MNYSTTQERRSWVQPHQHYPSLDGLRGLAILTVVICHYVPIITHSKIASWCWTGVDLFFVLSGFLITGNLFDSLSSGDYYSSFYRRRAFRIFPLYYGVLFLIYASTLLNQTVAVHGTFALNLVYLSNLAVPLLDLNKHNPTTVQFFWAPAKAHLETTVGAFWSLCVEEQFYLLWPFLMRKLGTRTRMLRFCAVVILLAPFFRVLLLHVAPFAVLDRRLLYTSTYSRCDELFMGAWCALWLRGVQLSRVELRRIALGTATVAGALLVLGASLSHSWPNDPSHVKDPFVTTFGFTLIGLVASALLVASLDLSLPITQVVSFKLFKKIGLVSYGIYVFHMLPMSVLQIYLDKYCQHHHLAWVGLIGIFSLVYGVAWVSYSTFELPIMRLGKRQTASRAGRSTSPKPRLAHVWMQPRVRPSHAVSTR